MSDPAELRMFGLGMVKGKEIESERIIKLLEDQVCPDSFCAHDLCVHTLQVIELIKGEQK